MPCTVELPDVLGSFITVLGILPRVVVIVSIKRLKIPFVLAQDRVRFTKVSDDSQQQEEELFNVIAMHGS
jgi:hypothetical protein